MGLFARRAQTAARLCMPLTMWCRVAKCEDRLAALETSGHDRSQLSRSEEERPSAAKGGRAGLTSDVAARRWDGGGLGSVSEHERWKSEL